MSTPIRSVEPSPQTPGPRAQEARFLATSLVPFVEAAIERAFVRRGMPPGSPRAPLDGSASALEHFVASAANASSALAHVAASIGLDVSDVAILAFAVAPYLEPRIARRYRELQESVLDDRVSVGLALELLCVEDEARYLEFARFQPERTLFRDGILTLELPTGARGDGLADRVLCAPQRTIDRMLGWPRLDDRIRPYCVLETMAIPLESVILPPDKQRNVLSLVRHHGAYREAVQRLGFARAIPYGRGITLLFAGPPGTGKTLLARAIAHALGKPLLRVYADRLAETNDVVEPLVLGLFREAALADAIVFFDECEGLFSKRSSKLAFLLSELERFEGIVILATNSPHQIDDAMDRRIVHRLDFEIPEPEERLQIWELHLPAEAPVADDVDLPLLSSLFAVSGGAIKNAVLVALNRAIDANPQNPVLDMATLRAAAEGQLKFNLEELTHKSRVKLTLNDLILPPADRDKIDEIIQACKNKEFVQSKWGFGRRLVTGKGICVLFDGAPGTGKTLCAEILASALDRTVYRVNVANVMSKWMGETEKNIAQIFQRAKATQAMLLFDEADSLFAKRTEVTNSNDRFANQEVNLLLQEVERFDGIVILTTNLFGGLDDALKRRIQYRVTFPRPTPHERLRIFKMLIPREAPLASDVDLEALVQSFDFTGGNIKNVIMRAAYLACAQNCAISMAHLVAACRGESESSGMLFREPQPTTVKPEPSIAELEKFISARKAWRVEGGIPPPKPRGQGELTTWP